MSVKFEVFDKASKSVVLVDPNAIYRDKSGEYPALIEKIYENIVTVKRGPEKYENKSYPVADLRVAFGTEVVRSDARGVKTTQPEFKPVSGVKLRGTGNNPMNEAWYLPNPASADLMQQVSDNEKNRVELLNEIESLRSQIRKEGKSSDAIPSDTTNSDELDTWTMEELRSYADSAGIIVSRKASRSEILVQIRKFKGDQK